MSVATAQDTVGITHAQSRYWSFFGILSELLTAHSENGVLSLMFGRFRLNLTRTPGMKIVEFYDDLGISVFGFTTPKFAKMLILNPSFA